MKKFLPWPDESLAAVRTLLKDDPTLRAEVDAVARSRFLVPPKIPKICFDSQKRAWSELINKSWGMKVDAQGNVASEKFYLEMVAASGTAASVGDLRWFLGGVWPVRLKHSKGIVYDETLQPDTVLLPDKDGLWASEARLNSFLKRLGKALANKKERGEPLFVPDWQHGVDKTLQVVVAGWCERIWVDGEHWPPLCCLSAPALAKFLTLCKQPLWKQEDSPRTLEQKLWRGLKLVRIPNKGRIQDVEKRLGYFRFR